MYTPFVVPTSIKNIDPVTKAGLAACNLMYYIFNHNNDVKIFVGSHSQPKQSSKQ